MHARRGRTGGLVAAIFAAFVLSACQIPPPSTAELPAAPPVSESQQPAPEPAVPAPAHSVGQTETAALPLDAIDQTETAALPPEPKIDDDPARLMGLDAAELALLLGAPDLLRREPPAEIWQYRGATCVFDVFLYEQTGQQRVTYLEARDGTAQRIGARACLNELFRARLPQPLG